MKTVQTAHILAIAAGFTAEACRIRAILYRQTVSVWSAAQERWLEVSSVSNFETYQANRLKCRFRGEDKKVMSPPHRRRICHGSPSESSSPCT